MAGLLETQNMTTAGNAVAAVAKTKSATAAVHSSMLLPEAERPEKFSGLGFKWWQHKMLFYLTLLGVADFVKEDEPVVEEEETTDLCVRAAHDNWCHGDYLCKNYILNGLEDSLYSMYANVKTSKMLWDALDRRYRVVEELCSKKFVVGRFLNYKMDDSRPVMDQVQELELIVHEIHEAGMVLPEAFVVDAIIEKLPPSWNDFEYYLKRKRKEMSLEYLILKLRIETEIRKNRQRPPVTIDAKEKRKQEFDGDCYNCGESGHMGSQCTKPKKKKKPS